jgi:hypothetical protein
MNILYARKLIAQHGHLVMEGDEPKEELMTALIFLRQHTFKHCHRPDIGTPMEKLVPDVSVLYPSARTS